MGKEPGHYFVGKKVRNASVSAIRTEQSQHAEQESQGEMSEEQMAEGQESSSNRQPDDKKELKETDLEKRNKAIGHCWITIFFHGRNVWLSAASF